MCSPFHWPWHSIPPIAGCWQCRPWHSVPLQVLGMKRAPAVLSPCSAAEHKSVIPQALALIPSSQTFNNRETANCPPQLWPCHVLKVTLGCPQEGAQALPPWQAGPAAPQGDHVVGLSRAGVPALAPQWRADTPCFYPACLGCARKRSCIEGAHLLLWGGGTHTTPAPGLSRIGPAMWHWGHRGANATLAPL